MQGYTYQARTAAWVCHKCSALVDNPQVHANSHEELITAMSAWAVALTKPATVPTTYWRGDEIRDNEDTRS